MPPAPRQLIATIDVHLHPADLHTSLANDVLVGLTATPKWLPPKWFYDDRGSELFDQITRLPEYYPTEAERAILTDHAEAIAERAGADVLVELGSGTSDKTRLLLDALCARGLRGFAPFDVSEGILRYAAAVIEQRHPELVVHGVVGDFERHLSEMPSSDGVRLVAFLGGTIGNLLPAERHRFLSTLAAHLRPGEGLLLGTDLVKSADRLIAAYDDRAGVTAAFNRNVLNVLNRELDADFDLEAFAHEAHWSAADTWIEMRLRARRAQRVRVGELDLDVTFAAGEALRTEISAKFTPGGLARELAAAGFAPAGQWTDPAGDFLVSHWKVDRRVAPSARPLRQQQDGDGVVA